MKKGVSLPINVVVILVIAIIVMLGVILFFTKGFSGSSTGLNCESKLRSGCTQFSLRGGCNDNTNLKNSDVQSIKTLVEGINCTEGGKLKTNQITLAKAQSYCCQGG